LLVLPLIRPSARARPRLPPFPVLSTLPCYIAGMSNPDPNRATRFKPGTSGNPGGKPRGPERATVLRAAPRIRTLEEIRQDPNGWRGSMADLLRAVALDPEQTHELRMSCANALLRFEGEKAGGQKRHFDLKHLTERERAVFLHVFNKATGQPAPVPPDPELVDCFAWLAEADADVPLPPKPKPPRPPRQAAAKPSPREPPRRTESAPGPAQRSGNGIAGGTAGAVLIGRPDRGTKCGQCGGSLFDAEAAGPEPRRWCCPRCAPLPSGTATLTIDTTGDRAAR
jgi:Family of unknown function (DUF5681)